MDRSGSSLGKSRAGFACPTTLGVGATERSPSCCPRCGFGGIEGKRLGGSSCGRRPACGGCEPVPGKSLCYGRTDQGPRGTGAQFSLAESRGDPDHRRRSCPLGQVHSIAPAEPVTHQCQCQGAGPLGCPERVEGLEPLWIHSGRSSNGGSRSLARVAAPLPVGLGVHRRGLRSTGSNAAELVDQPRP